MLSGASQGSAVVAEAKLVVPSVRPDTIVRERLVALLDEALDKRPLTVICAPAGYGKTTAVVTWLDTTGDAHAWVTLDALDNDPRRLCAHALTSIDRALPDIVDDAWQALAGGSDLLGTVLPLAATALGEQLDRRLVVVLDDYEVLEHPDGHALVQQLIETVPPLVRVIVCTRTVPPLRIARRRALGTVAELGMGELSFRPDECGWLLNDALGLGLDPDTVRAIAARVEGWAAGLALVASSLQSRPDDAGYARGLAERQPDLTGPAVADYLIEEVLDHLDPSLRTFMCHTSILRRLNGPLCAAVLEDPDAHQLLAEVCRSNAFVTVLDEPGDVWFRYHHLLAELLRRQLHATAPDLVAVLHRRAAEWLAANGHAEEAIIHAIAAGDGERAAALLFDAWPKLIAQWRFVTIRRLIALMPPDRGELAGFCAAIDTVCWALEGADLRLVSGRLDALEAVRDQPGVAPIIDRMRVSPFYGDIGRAVKHGWAAWERYPDPGSRAKLAAQFGMTLWFAGDRVAARKIIEPFLGEMQVRARSWALGTLALAAADDGDLALAESYGRQAVEAISPRSDMPRHHFARTALAEALRLRGALDEAAEQFAQAARLTGAHPRVFDHAFNLVFEARLALTRRDRAHACDCARQARAILGRYPDPGILADRLSTVEAILAQRADDELSGTAPTAAEQRVLDLLATDLTIEQIAAQLYLSPHTVATHRRRLYRRLGATTRAQAVAAAHRRGLLPTD